MSETWRPIPDFPGYMASSLGRIRSHRIDATGRPMTPNPHPTKRYLCVTVQQGERQRSRPVHVLVALAFHGRRPVGMVTRHLDGSRTNNRPDNLAWGTPAENSADRELHGTVPHIQKTHCPSGHLYDDVNGYVRASGARRCRQCDREQVTKKRGSDPMTYAIRQWARSNGFSVAKQGVIPKAIREAFEQATRRAAA